MEKYEFNLTLEEIAYLRNILRNKRSLLEEGVALAKMRKHDDAIKRLTEEHNKVHELFRIFSTFNQIEDL